jgi:hypothetical protein
MSNGSPDRDRDSGSDGNGTISVKVSFKRRRLLLQFNPESQGLDVSDADSDLGQEIPLQIGSFRRYGNFVQLDHPQDDQRIGIRYSCNGHVYKSVRLVTGLNSQVIVLECVSSQCNNIFAFLSRGALYIFGLHQH